MVLCVVAMRKALLHAINTDAAGDSDEWRAVATQLKVRGYGEGCRGGDYIGGGICMGSIYTMRSVI